MSQPRRIVATPPGFDSFEPGDVRSESGGETRLLRYSHGADGFYSASAWRARAAWREAHPILAGIDPAEAEEVAALAEEPPETGGEQAIQP